MMFPVLEGVGTCGAAEKRGTDMSVFHVTAVFAIVNNRKTEAVVGKVRPFVHGNLELCKFPGCICCCGAFDITELYVKGCLCRVDVNGVIRLENNVILMPVRLVIHVNSP